jgi:hypothetical protein
VLHGFDDDRSARASVHGSFHFVPQRICGVGGAGGDVVVGEVEHLGCEVYAKGVPFA